MVLLLLSGILLHLYVLLMSLAVLCESMWLCIVIDLFFFLFLEFVGIWGDGVYLGDLGLENGLGVRREFI